MCGEGWSQRLKGLPNINRFVSGGKVGIHVTFKGDMVVVSRLGFGKEWKRWEIVPWEREVGFGFGFGDICLVFSFIHENICNILWKHLK